MEYKLPPLPEPLDAVLVEWRNQTEMLTPRDDYYLKEQMRQYAEQAVAPLRAEIDRLHGEIKWLQDRVEFWQKCFDDVTNQ